MNTITEAAMRHKRLEDLRHLLSHRSLGPWGMETLIDTLNQIVPELRKNPVYHEQHSATVE